ncbi:MAG: twin-arginine translocation signal domain-containing protein, partial [Prevotella sp.]
MDRRNFLKMSAAGALLAASDLSGVSRLFARNTAVPGNGNKENGDVTTGSVIDDWNYRHLMGLGVSPIGLGCLPMVGYYGGKYDKADMVA